MKTEEDEAFDDLARRQGAWGGGFKAKQAMAADKQREDRIKYGTSWEKDGERIDPMSVYKEPVTEREALKLALEALEGLFGTTEQFEGGSVAVWRLGGSAQPKQAITAIKEALAQLAQEPHGYDWSMLEAAKESLREHMARIKELEAALAQPAPLREWVGLTDEEIDEGNKQSWVTKQAWESAVWWASEKLKEKNNG